MSAFVQKLIEDTKSGELDSIWKCNSSEDYVWSLPKHPFNGMKLTIVGYTSPSNKVKTEAFIIMPNGSEIFDIPIDSAFLLKDEIMKACLRWNEQIISDYLQSGLAQPEEEQNQNEENTQEEENGTTKEN